MVQTYDTEPVWDKPPDVDEKWIQYVDDNVSSSRLPWLQLHDLHFLLLYLIESRSPSGDAYSKHFPLRGKLLDKDRRDSYSASRWTANLLFLEGLTIHGDKFSLADAAGFTGDPARDRQSHGVRRVSIYELTL